MAGDRLAVRLLALDLDGTLLDDMRSVPSRTRRALARAAAQGIHVVLATGRGFHSARRYWQELALQTPMICYQGAMVIRPADACILHSWTLSREQTAHIIEVCRRYGVKLQLYTLDHTAYAESIDAEAVAMHRREGTPFRQVTDLMALAEATPIKGLIVGLEEEVPAIAETLRTHLNVKVEVVRSHPRLLELIPRGVSKGAALAWLAAHLGVAREETMAIGDHDNDADMIRWAGIGVAMGNASAAARAYADRVAPPVSEEGAARFIETHLLQHEHKHTPGE